MLANESVTLIRMIVVVLSFVGAMLVVEPPFLFGDRTEEYDLPYRNVGVICALIASIFIAFEFHVLRQAMLAGCTNMQCVLLHAF